MQTSCSQRERNRLGKKEGKSSSACHDCCLRPRFLSGQLGEVSADLSESECYFICWVPNTIYKYIQIQIQILYKYKYYTNTLSGQLKEVSADLSESECCSAALICKYTNTIQILHKYYKILYKYSESECCCSALICRQHQKPIWKRSPNGEANKDTGGNTKKP